MSIREIEASAIVSRDGLLITEAFAAMTATMLGAAETVSSELGKGVPDRVIVESNAGKIVATGAGSKALLVVMTNPKATLGLVLFEINKAREKIKGRYNFYRG